ncbi:MAG: hypothetical protein V7699_00575 [Porticoccus sp.]
MKTIRCQSLAIGICFIFLGVHRSACATPLLVVEAGGGSIKGLLSSRFEQRYEDESSASSEELWGIERTAELQGRYALSGYVWKPWFSHLMVDSGIFVSGATNSRNDKSGTQISMFGDGNSELTIFPGSRFPFSAGLKLRNNKVDAGFGGSDFQEAEVDFKQLYRPLSSLDRYSARYSRLYRDAENSGKSRNDYADFSVNASRGAHQMIGNLQYRSRGSDASGSGEEFFSSDYQELLLYGQHVLQQESNLSLRNVVSYFIDEEKFDSNDLGQSVWQASSTGRWRPWSEHKLTVNGSARIDSRDQERESGSNLEQTNIFSRLGVNYQPSASILTFINASWRESTSNTIDSRFIDQMVGINYNPEVIPLGDYDYRWFSSLSLQNRFETESGSVQESGGLLGHNLSLHIPWGGSQGTRLSASQTIRGRADTDPEEQAEQTLTNRLSFSQGHIDRGVSSRIRITADDVRNFGEFDEDESTYQLLNILWSRESTLGINSSWSSDMTAQFTVDDDKDQDDVSSWVYSWDMRYTHNQLFNLRHLNFETRFDFSTRHLISAETSEEQDNESLFDGINREESAWSSKVSYTVGHLQVNFRTRVSKVEGRQFGLVMLEFRRYLDIY